MRQRTRRPLSRPNLRFDHAAAKHLPAMNIVRNTARNTLKVPRGTHLRNELILNIQRALLHNRRDLPIKLSGSLGEIRSKRIQLRRIKLNLRHDSATHLRVLLEILTKQPLRRSLRLIIKRRDTQQRAFDLRIIRTRTNRHPITRPKHRPKRDTNTTPRNSELKSPNRGSLLKRQTRIPGVTRAFPNSLPIRDHTARKITLSRAILTLNQIRATHTAKELFAGVPCRAGDAFRNAVSGIGRAACREGGWMGVW